MRGHNEDFTVNVPNEDYTTIVFPGRVINDENALRSLGGEEAISRANPPKYIRHVRSSELSSSIFSQRAILNSNAVDEHEAIPLQCRLDPDNVQSAVLTGKTSKCKRFLIKRKFSASNRSWSIECLGRISSEITFSGLCDFSIASLQQVPDIVNALPNEMRIVDTPYNYAFANGGRKDLEAIQNHDNVIRNESSEGPQYIGFAASAVPQTPSRLSSSSSHVALNHDCTKAILEIFDEQPCWLQQALILRLKGRFVPGLVLKYLPCVAYRFMNGPWRTVWTKFGVDPRLDPSLRFYQVIEFRLDQEEFELLKRSVESDQGKEITPSILSFESPPVKRNSIIQLKNLSKELQVLVTSSGCEDMCKKTSGWFDKSTIEALRNAMKSKVKIWIRDQSSLDQDEEKSHEIDPGESGMPPLEENSADEFEFDESNIGFGDMDGDSDEFEIFDE